MRQLWILVAILELGELAGCKANPTGEKESGGGGLAGLGGGEAQDWTGKKLVTMEGTVEGLSFTIELPEGLPREKRNKSDWDDQDPAHYTTPKVFTSTFEISRIQDLKQAKYHATLDAAAKTWVREQSRPDSWALTYAEEDKTRIEAITYKQATDKLFIRCKAVQATVPGPGVPIPNYAKSRTMLENMCDSLKPKGEAPPAEAPPEPVEKAPSEKPAGGAPQ